MNKLRAFFDQLLDLRTRLGLRLCVVCLMILTASLAGCFKDPDMDAVSVGVGLVFGWVISFFMWAVIHHFIHRHEVVIK